MVLRVGVVGSGWIASRMVGEMVGHRDIDVAGVWSRDRRRRELFCDGHDVSAATGLEELLSRRLDLLYIATTPSSHRELSITALQSGVPILVEKAFATTAAEAADVLRLARRLGLFAMEAMWMRFNPVVRRVAAVADAGDIGDVRTLMCSAGYPAPADHRLWNAATGGGTLLDQAVYPLTLAAMLLGPIRGLTASATTTDYEGRPAGVDSELSVTTHHDADRRGIFHTSARGSLPCDAHIGGSRGQITLDTFFWNPPRAHVVRTGERSTIAATPDRPDYAPMLDAVVEALGSGYIEHPLCTHDDTLAIMTAVDLIRARIGR